MNMLIYTGRRMQLVEITSSVVGSIANEKLSREVVLGGHTDHSGFQHAHLISSFHYEPLEYRKSVFIFQILRSKQTANEQEV